MPLGGLVVPAITLFGEGGKLDLPKNSRFVRGLIDDGVRHILVLGAPGEGALLSSDERERLVEKAVESCTFGTDVWAGIEGRTPEDATALADSAEACGASVLVALAPKGETEEGFRARCRALHGDSKLPIVAYLLPPPLGASFGPEALHALAAEGALDGVVDATGEGEHLSKLLTGAPSTLSVLGGDGRASVDALGSGARGVVWETANVLPRLASELWNAHEKGSKEKVAELWSLEELLLKAVREAPRPASLKFLSAFLRETDEGYRSPNDPLTDAQKAKVVAVVEPRKAALQEFA